MYRSIDAISDKCDDHVFYLAQCVITRNAKGGFKCEKGGAVYRGSPKISDSNIFDNSLFDIMCAQKENYDFTNIFIGAEASHALAKNSSATMANIIDGRNGSNGFGVVTIRSVASAPVPGCGATPAVLQMSGQ